MSASINTTESVKCDKCGSSMVLRKGKYGQFYGCSNFAKGRCKNTRPYDGSSNRFLSTNISSPKDINMNGYKAGWLDRQIGPMIEMLSDEQKLIHEKAVFGNTHLKVDSTAGSGKSFIQMTIAKSFMNQNPDGSVVYFCFNKSIAEEFVPKAIIDVNGMQIKACEVSTMHSAGNRAVTTYARAQGYTCDLSSYKSRDIAQTIIDPAKYPKEGEYDRIVGEICQYVDYCKGFMLDGSLEDCTYLARRFDMELRDEYPNYVQEIMHRSRKWIDPHNNKFVYDFNDMIWLPVVLSLPAPRVSLVLIDEAQDLNICQHHFIKRYADLGARVIIVGDFKQAIYGWRGADIESMNNLATLIGGADTAPMTVTRRNPRSHVEYINQHLIDYVHNALPDAPEGSIEYLNRDEIMNEIKPQSLMLSRTNAPLVSWAFRLLRAGKPVYICGRDFATQIINYIKKLKVKSIPALIDKVNNDAEKEIERVTKLAKGRGQTPCQAKLESIQDKRDAIIEIASGVKEDRPRANVQNVIDKIDEIFKDVNDKGKPANAITLSTVHRGKGLESENVYILTPELFPHPMAKRPEEVKQEYNCLFVALTRSMDRLVFLTNNADEKTIDNNMTNADIMIAQSNDVDASPKPKDKRGRPKGSKTVKTVN